MNVVAESNTLLQWKEEFKSSYLVLHLTVIDPLGLTFHAPSGKSVGCALEEEVTKIKGTKQEGTHTVLPTDSSPWDC